MTRSAGTRVLVAAVLAAFFVVGVPVAAAASEQQSRPQRCDRAEPHGLARGHQCPTPTPTYTVSSGPQTIPAGNGEWRFFFVAATCDTGDSVVSSVATPSIPQADGIIMYDGRIPQQAGYRVDITNNPAEYTVTVEATCADNPPLRTATG